MKKILAVLTLSTVCVAILFGQEMVKTPPVAVPEAKPAEQNEWSDSAQPMFSEVVSVETTAVESVSAETSTVELVAAETTSVETSSVESVSEELVPMDTVSTEQVVEEPVSVPEEPVSVAEEPVVAEMSPSVAPDATIAVQQADAVVNEDVVEKEDIAGSEDVAENGEAVETVEIGIADDMTAGAEIRGGLISLSLKDVELQDVVRLFSRLSNANIIVPDMLDEENPKRVDVNLDNVEWKPALKAILDTHGLELVEKIPGSEVYSIRERPADAPEPMEIKVFRLNYATVAEVVKMVETLVQKDGGQISTYPARNSIVAQGTAKMINDLEQIVQAVDLPREQVFIEAKFLELSDSASEQLGIDWNVLGGYGAGVNGIGAEYNSTKNKSDTTTRYRDISGLPFELLEDAPDGEWIQNESTGEWEFFSKIDYDSNPYGDSALTRIFGITPTYENISSEVVGKTLGATLNADDFNLVLSALKEMNGAKVVSNPKIIVANEETATIHIGSKKPNIKGTIQTAGDSQVSRVYALDDTEPYFEDGVRVDVTPTVNTEDNITVRIQPKLDRLDADPTMAPDGTEFWGKSTKTIETVFGLEDGQTAAIGGLTEASKSDVDRKVPLLGDLPFIGRLFSYSSKNSQQVETIIFVTVGMANPDSLAFETGLPEDSRLAMRYRTEASTDRAIEREELEILKTVESERLQDRLRALREAEEKRLEKVNK